MANVRYADCWGMLWIGYMMFLKVQVTRLQFLPFNCRRDYKATGTPGFAGYALRSGEATLVVMEETRGQHIRAIKRTLHHE